MYMQMFNECFFDIVYTYTIHSNHQKEFRIRSLRGTELSAMQASTSAKLGMDSHWGRSNLNTNYVIYKVPIHTDSKIYIVLCWTILD